MAAVRNQSERKNETPMRTYELCLLASGVRIMAVGHIKEEGPTQCDNAAAATAF